MYDNYLRMVNDFNIIIYARLSKEEAGKSKEEQSKSIKNQIEICKRYIEEEKKRYSNCHFEVIAILKDDGISGTTFEREDFKELINLIEKKRANMVITTDLSRLGRNHIKTDDYIEEWFPEHNVRYVSIVESVDTYADCMSNDIAPIINWSNEHFAKLTSKKIKSRFNLLRSEGKWTGGEPPLGYKLDPKNKYHFIIEEESAQIVKHIFELFNDNCSCTEVARILTDEKVPIPTILKKSKRDLNKDLMELWSPKTVREILSNDMYIGNMVQGKTTRLNHKSKKMVYLPKESWIVVPNTHEPIVDLNLFQTVQSLLKTDKNRSKKTYDYLLKGLLRCKECQRSIGIQHYKTRTHNYTVCNYYRKYGSRKKVCTAHRFIYEEIEENVLKDIKRNIESLDINLLLKRCWKGYINSMNRENDQERIEKCKKKIERLEREIDLIYEDKIDGIIDKEQCERIIKKRKAEIEYEQKLLNALIKDNRSQGISKVDYANEIRKFLEKLDKRTIFSLIDKILVSENGVLDIYYKFKNPFAS